MIRIRYGCNWLNYLGWPVEVESPPVPLNVLPAPTTSLDAPPRELVPTSFQLDASP